LAAGRYSACRPVFGQQRGAQEAVFVPRVARDFASLLDKLAFDTKSAANIVQINKM
jgi:hypothetical protein